MHLKKMYLCSDFTIFGRDFREGKDIVSNKHILLLIALLAILAFVSSAYAQEESPATASIADNSAQQAAPESTVSGSESMTPETTAAPAGGSSTVPDNPVLSAGTAGEISPSETLSTGEASSGDSAGTLPGGEPSTNTTTEPQILTDTAQTPDVQATSSAMVLATSAYGQLCTTSSCSANLTCKRDLWTPDSTCCSQNECAGNNACYTEYSCVSGPKKLCYSGGWIDVLNYEVNCVDGIDNDCDGTIDRADSDCYVPPVCGNGVCETGEDKAMCPADCGGERYIVVRNDDVAPWWSTDNEIYVNDYIRNMGIPVSMGIIPSTNGGSIKLGDDSKLVEYLTSIRNDPGVEISIHGLRHDAGEFQGIGRDASLSKMNEAKNMIKAAISVDPVTFIPPYYEYDIDTLYAANDAGMDYFSAGWNAVDMGHAFKEYPAGLMNIPATTDIYDWGAGSFYSISEIQSSCENAMTRFGTCVIVVHHQLFTDQNNNIDSEKIKFLNNIMAWVKSKESAGVKLKTFGKHKSTDSTLPSVAITSPIIGEIFTTPQITVRGTASDNVALDMVEIKIGVGSFQLASGTTSWVKNVTLSAGSNTIAARATDTSGNIRETSVTVTYNLQTVPDVPGNVKATPGNKDITLSWQAPANNGGSAITNYRIYRSTSSGSETYLTEVGNTLKYVDTGLTNGQIYYYKISAKNSNGEGPQSGETFGTPFTAQKKYIVFRNDDIGAYWDTAIVINVTEYVRSKDVPQVLGLVPMNGKSRLYDDPVMNTYLKSISSDNSFEFALHGYAHKQNEFKSMTYANALTKISNGTSIIIKTVGTVPSTFIPPYNVYNNNTMVAVATVFKSLNPTANIYMSTLSSGSDDIDRKKAFKISKITNMSQILHLPQTTDFYNWGTNSFYTVQEIENSCDSALSTYNICIITLHTQTFTTGGKVDANKLKILTDVIDWAKAKETSGIVTVARLMDISQNDLVCMKTNSCYN